jgi:aldehyde dehydrogenase (NAD+)
MKPRKVPTSLLHLKSTSKYIHEPLGLSAIISPWNFPFQLALTPLVSAIAAGNCALLKPSEQSPATTALIAKLISRSFPREYIQVLEGDQDVAKAVVAQADHVFFTGGIQAGSEIAAAAGSRLIPATLELGGKNPCIILPDADLKLAVKRIAWGKFFNCGQSCVAPDYLLIPDGWRDRVVSGIRARLEEFYPGNPAESRSYGRIINRTHLERLAGLLEGSRILYGGAVDLEKLYFGPTLAAPDGDRSPLMQQEIFGPILAILEYRDIREIESWITACGTPLAAYIFTGNPDRHDRWLSSIRCGSLVINDTISQFLSNGLPFGGVGNSGNGKYHGWFGYAAFSHAKAIFRKSNLIDIPLRYPPYNRSLELLRFLKYI